MSAGVIPQRLRPMRPEPTGAPATWGGRHAHDPTVVQSDDGTFYMYSTDAVANSASVPAGVHIRTSRDLVTWSYAGTALDGVPGPALDWTGAQGLWAPDVVRWHDGRWHMYYSASTFGSNTSAIGLAVSPDPSGPWEDLGLVVATRSGEHTQNAIDAAVTFDADGEAWLTYGSFFSGIYTLPLDRTTGRPIRDGDLGSLIACRQLSVEGAIEGAYIMYRPEEDKYVLFASYDSLFATYNVRVAVADSVTGPYRDFNGAAMTDLEQEPGSIGTKVLGSYRFDGDTGWLAPGHNSVFTRPGQAGYEHFMVHHVRFTEDPSQHTVQLRRLFFTEAGWPVVSPQPFAGEAEEVFKTPQAVSGKWRVIRLDPSSTGLVNAVPAELDAGATEALDGWPSNMMVRVSVELDGVELHGVEVDSVVFASWDWSKGQAALSFSGIDKDGVVWSGTKES